MAWKKPQGSGNRHFPFQCNRSRRKKHAKKPAFARATALALDQFPFSPYHRGCFVPSGPNSLTMSQDKPRKSARNTAPKKDSTQARKGGGGVFSDEDLARAAEEVLGYLN